MTSSPLLSETELEYARELQERRKARRSLIDFTQFTFPTYAPSRHHQLIAEKLEAVERGEITRLIILCPPRHGKACVVGTLVPTPDGLRKIEDLRPGDLVFGRFGDPVEVLAVSPVWTDRELYEVTSDDGARVVVDAEHEWTVRLDRKRPVYRRRSTRYLAARTSPRRPALQTYGAAQYRENDFVVPPYVLGVWLGDGTSNDAGITKGVRDLEEIRAMVEAEGVRTSIRSDAETFGLLGVKVQLRALGLLRNKHIPDAYLRGSVSQRRALLQGLIDTDGYVAPDGQVEFCTVIESLALSVLQLVRSLGVKASLITGEAWLNGRSYGPKYRVMFYMAGAARLGRKASLCRDGTRTPWRFLSFKQAGRGDTVCIQVASPDGQYLVGAGFLLTHNSELGSIRFPAWYIGRNPTRQMMLVSYDKTLARSFGRKVRNLVGSRDYRALFPDVRLSQDSKAADTWHTNKGGVYVSGGIGFGSGYGAHLLMVDDPYKTRQEADSPAFREQVDEWYSSTGRPRIMPVMDYADGVARDGAIVMFYTPWHELDLGCKQIDAMGKGGEHWEVLRLSALIETEQQRLDDPLGRKLGEALWPEWYNEGALLTIRNSPTTHPRDWQALYQCRPAGESGEYFKAEWFAELPDPMPRPLYYYISSDWAVSEKESADWTVHGVWAQDNRDTLYRVDAWRDRRAPDEAIEQWCNLIAKYKPMAAINESGVIRKALGPAMLAALRRRGLHVNLVDYPRTSDKVSFARSYQARMSGGFIRVDMKQPWFPEWRSEHLKFPAGQFDDQVDEGALVCRHLESMTSPEQYPSGPGQRGFSVFRR